MARTSWRVFATLFVLGIGLAIFNWLFSSASAVPYGSTTLYFYMGMSFMGALFFFFVSLVASIWDEPRP